VKGELLPIHHPCIAASRPRRGDHVGVGIHRHKARSRLYDLFGQHPIPAAEIEDVLPRQRSEQFE